MSKIFAYKKKTKLCANAFTAFVMTMRIWKSLRAKSSILCGPEKSSIAFRIRETDPPIKNPSRALIQSRAAHLENPNRDCIAKLQRKPVESQRCGLTTSGRSNTGASALGKRTRRVREANHENARSEERSQVNCRWAEEGRHQFRRNSTG